MSELAERFRKVAGQFTERARAVPPGSWDNPTPCEGWVARDVVRHMVDYMPGLFLDGAGVETPNVPSVDDDPVGAWQALCDALEAVLDDPEIAARELDLPIGHVTLEQAIRSVRTTSSFTPGIWPAPPASTRDSTQKRCTKSSRAWSHTTRPYASRVTSAPASRCPTMPTSRTKLLAFMGRRP